MDAKYKAALKEEANKSAFDSLYSEWSNEDAVTIYQWGDGGIYAAIDLLNLNSSILNRREILRLREDYERFLEKANSLER